jgi:hypothetical protein
MKMKIEMKIKLVFLSVGLLSFFSAIYLLAGCAQIGAPTGGPKDTLAPVLIKAMPDVNKTNFSENKIILQFNEYIELQDLQNNLLISPYPKNNPTINCNLKTITIKLKDTLAPNTTYSFNFGNSIRDINEGNKLTDFSYLFSTGDFLDSLELTGNVMMAETGMPDSTLSVLLYKNIDDSSITTRKPDYISRIKSNGNFSFKYLPNGNYKIYALKDGDGNKFYSTKSESFAFYDSVVNPLVKNKGIQLYAYQEKKSPPNSVASADKKTEKKLRYSNNLINGKQDLLKPLELSFNTALKNITPDSIFITDTSFNAIKNIAIKADSSRKKIILSNKWIPNETLYLIVYKNAIEDSNDLKLAKNDTIKFYTKGISEYGSLKLHFKNIELAKHPLLLFLEGDNIKSSFAILADEWSNSMILPGELEWKILYDENGNGKWDPGDYSKKLQPEKTIAFPQRISIKADWENERDVDLKQP